MAESSDIPPHPPVVGVEAEPKTIPALAATAAGLAKALHLPLADTLDEGELDLLLAVTPERLELRVVAEDSDLAGGHPVAIDLGEIDTRSPMGRSLRQPLLRAVGVRKGESERPRVLDATAGFGEDSWLLASMGCPVLAVERVPVMAALLCDAVRRAAAEDPGAAGRLSVIHGNSIGLLRRLARDEPGGDFPPAFAKSDVVYLDPMFPTGRKARERKPMRVLRWLVGEDPDAGELLSAALAAATRRVVVKRPAKADFLPGPVPSATHEGRAVRYDVYGISK
ncbi:MAG: class I SAM-dependent methyltransferase [Phycisphaeraceae bacterium]